MKKFSFLTFLAIALFSVQVFAQGGKGKVSGKLIDKANGEDLIGAVVQVEGQNIGTATDIEGQFLLSLDPGFYTLILNYVSYKSEKIQGVEVKAGQVTYLNFAMQEESTQLEEVVITYTVEKSTDDALLIEQKSNVAMSSGISGEQIRKMPDRTAADALKRVSGASIQDNKFAVIRGLSDRYNMAYLNGTPLPSSESDRKAFSLELVPAQLLDGINITKTATPDMPGDFAGGFIQIKTKDIPSENKNFISAGLGYNSITTFKDFSKGKSGSTDFLGYDNKTRVLSNELKPREVMEPVYNQPINQNLPLLTSQTKAINNDFNYKTISARPDISLQIGTSRRYDIKNNSLGVLFAWSYNNSLRYIPFTNDDPLVGGVTSLPPRNIADGKFLKYESWRSSVNNGGIFNLAFSYRKNHKFAWKNLYNLISQDQLSIREGEFSNSGRTDIQLSRDRAFYYLSNRMYSTQLSANHYFEVSKLKLDYVLGLNSIARNLPDFKRISYKKVVDVDDQFQLSAIGFTAPVDQTSSGRFSSKLLENSYSADVSLSRSFEKINTKIKIGYFTQVRDRNFKARVFNYAQGNFSGLSYNPFVLEPDTIFNPGVLNSGAILNKETTTQQDQYTASSLIHAGFFMIENNIKDKLRLIYGVRVERFNQKVKSYFLGSDINVDINWTDVLPSSNLIYSITDKSNLRFSYSKTLSRPEFREFARLAFFDFDQNAILIGNPNLNRAKIDNIDLKFECYPSANQFIAINPFYKLFKDPVEMIFEPFLNSRQFSYINAKSANAYGVEVETRYGLRGLSELMRTNILNNFVINGNFALIKSQVNLEGTLANEDVKNRPLQGQSPYVVNAGLSYNADSIGLSINLSVNRIGDRIAFIANENNYLIYEKARTVIDASINKSFFKNKLQTKLVFADILAQRLIFYQDLNKNAKYDKSIDLASLNFRNAFRINLGVTYNF